MAVGGWPMLCLSKDLTLGLVFLPGDDQGRKEFQNSPVTEHVGPCGKRVLYTGQPPLLPWTVAGFPMEVSHEIP
jgi:hypothetical protein